jgi:hypothetical protein
LREANGRGEFIANSFRTRNLVRLLHPQRGRAATNETRGKPLGREP